ncbi:MAG: single-stranded DNA-binding protein [Sphingomonadales bacterium]|nr:single-stranded DNA-binding protein [Sphingomonadales bacterium]
MGGLNKVMLIGNLGKTPEIRVLDNGSRVATFPLATTETYKDREGVRQSKTEWHNVVMWRGLADLAERLLTKGAQVYIEGHLTTRKWEDKDGHQRFNTEVVGDNLILLGRTSDRPENPAVASGERFESPESEGKNDLPF